MPPRSSQRSVYWTCPTSSPATSLVVTVCRAATAAGPSISNSPMWLTSKRPTVDRTFRCSSMMPTYWTGMSQPPNATMRAPSLRCAAWSGVRLSSEFMRRRDSVDHPVVETVKTRGRVWAPSPARQPLTQRLHLAARFLQSFPHRPHYVLGSRRVAVAADGLHRDVDGDAIQRGDLAFHRHLHGLGRRSLGIGDERAGDLARDERAIHVVGAIGKALGGDPHAHLATGPVERSGGGGHEDEIGLARLERS